MTQVGFTGSSDRLPVSQAWALGQVFDLLAAASPATLPTLHHGLCVGADALAHVIARASDWPIVGHPGPPTAKRADLPPSDFVFLHDPLPFLARNQVIVDSSLLLVACPSNFAEVLRSGTWATIRRARRAGIPRILVFPDGTVNSDIEDG